MILLEKPNRKGEVGAGKPQEIKGRVDFIVPHGRGIAHAWTIGDGATVAVSLSGDTRHKHPEMLVLSLPRDVARYLRDELSKVVDMEGAR